MQAVKKRWNQAQKVYQIIQNEKEEELKKIKGRQHLSEMLEHSTQLLEAQLTSSREPTVEAESDDNSTTLTTIPMILTISCHQKKRKTKKTTHNSK